MGEELCRSVLKGVSRSFYLSLRLLPAPMRLPAGIAYLLARTSDTIADSAGIAAAERLDWLDRLALQVDGAALPIPFPRELIAATPDASERMLLEMHVDVISALYDMSPEISHLIRDVLAIIISGQKMDLERFGDRDSGKVRALASDEELEDYTWRVAGCVGEFWSKLGFETLGENFSKSPPDELVCLGVDFGKGLQLVNILRDLPRDLREGRCYLPLADSNDRDALMGCFSKWHTVALQRMDSGIKYAAKLRSKRLRTASALPALIGRETIALMKNVSWEDLEAGIRIPRSRVYALLLRTLIH